MLRRLRDTLFARPKPPETTAPSGDGAGERVAGRAGRQASKDRILEQARREALDEPPLPPPRRDPPTWS